MKPNKIDIVSDSTMNTLYKRASSVIEQARETAYRQVNEALVKRNWDLGKLIAEEELNGQNRATYGASIIKARVSPDTLTEEAGRGRGSLLHGSLLDGELAAVVATFAAYGVVNVPCTAVGADSQSGYESLVVSTTLGSAGL